jgi:hypothetical protein
VYLNSLKYSSSDYYSNQKKGWCFPSNWLSHCTHFPVMKCTFMWNLKIPCIYLRLHNSLSKNLTGVVYTTALFRALIMNFCWRSLGEKTNKCEDLWHVCIEWLSGVHETHPSAQVRLLRFVLFFRAMSVWSFLNIKKFYVVPTLRLCVLYGSQNKQQLLPYKTLTDWFL